MEDVKSAAEAMNDRTAGLEFVVSVASGNDFEDAGDQDTLMKKGKIIQSTLESGKMSEKLQEGKKSGTKRGGMCGCLSLSFYQPYFDVDTLDIQARILRALLPFQNKDPKFYDIALTSPDAYGPFWLSTTLIFCIASSSNAASYLDFMKEVNRQASIGIIRDMKWTYDFSRLASACTIVEIFVLGFPVLVWGYGKYMNLPLSLTFLVCLYGYAMTIFIPVTILSIIPADGFDWVILLFAMLISLYFLLSNIWAVVHEHVSKEKTLPILAFIGTTHLIWCIFLKLIFF